jgi:uncharacterized membrane-anchored protein YjiN (DUF445 family)
VRPPPAPRLSEAEARRARLLVVTRRRATGLLVAVAALVGLSTAFLGDARWLAWVQATALASLVGGLADWFAVTALFRRPLGLPIPHTAIVVERKDRFAATLGSFVQESFLSAPAVTARLRDSAALARLGAWLADPEHARDLAGRAAGAMTEAADLLREADVLDAAVRVARRRLDRVRLAPLAGRVLDQLTREGRHQPVLDAALTGLARYLAAHGPELHARLGAQSPWWLPGRFSQRLVNRLLAQTESVLADMAANRRHPLRLQLEEGLATLARRLRTDPELARRGEELKAELLAHPAVRQLAATVWSEARTELRAQAADPGSELRDRLAAAIAAAGGRLAGDPGMGARLEQMLTWALVRFDTELSGLVTGTIARWDATETSRRLELLLGPDLQYIRINGTVVGALAGLALHALTTI